MKFWKLLCAAGCLGFVLILLLAYVTQAPGGVANNSDPTAPHPAPPIFIPN